MRLGSGEWVTPTIQLLRQIDEGAMGSVWVAHHVALGTEVAVKFVADHFAKNRKALRRLQAEARACAQLKSPHVVKIFDYGTFEGEHPYFVMELLEGESLCDRFERDEPLSLREAALLVTHVARGLHSAHRLGIVHRDIKPANLFLLDVDDEFFVKILDFGVAKGLTKGVTEPGLLVGTPLYMSREAIVDNHVDHRCDLWALSVVAYECLTGQLPFDGESLDDVCTSIWRGKFTPPSELNPTLTPAVDAWFQSAFHRERQERAPAAKQLAAGFVRALSTVPGAIDSDGAGDDWRISQLDLSSYAPSSSRPPMSSDAAPASIKPIVFTPPPPDSESPPDSIRAADSSPSAAFDDAHVLVEPAPPNVQLETSSGVTLPPPPRRRGFAVALGAIALVGAVVIALAWPSDTATSPATLSTPTADDAPATTASAPPQPSAAASTVPAPSASQSAVPASPPAPAPRRLPANTAQQPALPRPAAPPEKDLGF